MREPVVLKPVVLERRGHPELGRNLVVVGDIGVPPNWAGAAVTVVDGITLAEPASVVERLRDDALRRCANVFRIQPDIAEQFGDNSVPREIERRPLHEVGPTHQFWIDELRHLVWSNSVDGRNATANSGEPDTDPPGDLTLPDGTRAWVDAGPPRYLEPIDGVPVISALQLAFGQFQLPLGNSTTADLAPDQLEAVTHPGGSARIIAPAGSGKTRVLAERARHLARQWRVPVDSMTVVAFNKRAQVEISTRIADLPGVQVRTLNSIGLSIINGVAPFAPTRDQFRTLDELDVRKLLNRFVSTPKKLNVDPIATWIDALSVARLGLVDPVDVEAMVGSDITGFAQIFPVFRAELDRARAVDFDEQIVRAIELLLRDPVARAAAQRACTFLLVDEFQDLTPAHILLIRLLKGPHGTVFGVGDDDQTIYGYNGADPRWLIEFAQHFPGAQDHPLEVNYRCPGGVVDVADRLLRHNRRRVPKVIRAASVNPGGWSVHQGDDPVAATLQIIDDGLRAGGTPSDFAVLTRVNASLAPVQVALTLAGVGVDGGVGVEFLNRTAVRAAMAWLRLGADRRFDSADMAEALRRPTRGLHPKVRDWVAEQTDLASLDRLAGRLTNDKDATKVRSFAADIARLQRLTATRATTSQLVAALTNDLGLAGSVSTLDDGRYGMNRSAQSDDLSALAFLAKLLPDPATFESSLRRQLSASKSHNGVLLSTVHRVKGQEWPNVVVHLADADQFPHRLADNVEEERRLFHVAITRTSGHVSVVAGDTPSPFIAELTTEPAAHAPASAELVARPGGVGKSSPATASGGKRPERADHPLISRDTVYAVPGLVLVDQGHEWTVLALEPEAAVAERGTAVRRFAVGEAVETRGRQRGKLRPRPGNVSDQSVVAFDELRRFRARVADGKPAYTVFDDKTLAAIAAALPPDDSALLQVKGVGAVKLEQYGDDVLGVVASVLAATPR
ncbi:MAG TPA: ATP-dependent DNA helicase UvrD2 [Ilumatobacter sp.]|nr:ATP-dependent DNA helicase UvrD2 [Ilumatobacter sp.]